LICVKKGEKDRQGRERGGRGEYRRTKWRFGDREIVKLGRTIKKGLQKP
jgi:hypothetical protein